MQTPFYWIYRQLFERYRRGVDVPYRRRFRSPAERMAAITSAIEFASADAGITRRLRPDARYFLLVNIDHMVLAPLSHRGAPPEALESLQDTLTQDVQTILEAAKDLSTDDEISGHDVVGALSRVWDTLGLTSVNIWG